MHRIRPFWRIVIGLLIGFAVFINIVDMAEHGPAGFIFWAAFLVAYIFAAVRVPYDDPLRSMRDLLAQQAAEKAEAGKDPASDRDADRIAALEKELSELRDRLDRESNK